jgi:hypothetical protein
LFSLAVKTASKLTFIKHNLIKEHLDLYKSGHQQGFEAPEEKLHDDIAADDIIIEDC